MALFAERAQRRGLILSPRIADDVPPALCGNSTRLQQALSNLLANAIKFSERGTVAVHTDLDQRPPEQCLEFSATRYNELNGSQAHVTHVRFSVVDRWDRHGSPRVQQIVSAFCASRRLNHQKIRRHRPGIGDLQTAR